MKNYRGNAVSEQIYKVLLVAKCSSLKNTYTEYNYHWYHRYLVWNLSKKQKHDVFAAVITLAWSLRIARLQVLLNQYFTVKVTLYPQSMSNGQWCV